MVTVIDTPSAVDANSYISQADANAYFADTINAAAWVALADEDAKAHLVSATAYLDLFEYEGERTVAGQALAHPRQYLNDREEYGYVDSTVVVADMKKGTCELALYLKANAEAFETRDTLREAKLGPLLVKFDRKVFGEFDSLPMNVQRLVMPYFMKSRRGGGLERS